MIVFIRAKQIYPAVAQLLKRKAQRKERTASLSAHHAAQLEKVFAFLDSGCVLRPLDVERNLH